MALIDVGNICFTECRVVRAENLEYISRKCGPNHVCLKTLVWKDWKMFFGNALRLTQGTRMRKKSVRKTAKLIH